MVYVIHCDIVLIDGIEGGINKKIRAMAIKFGSFNSIQSDGEIDVNVIHKIKAE